MDFMYLESLERALIELSGKLTRRAFFLSELIQTAVIINDIFNFLAMKKVD